MPVSPGSFCESRFLKKVQRPLIIISYQPDFVHLSNKKDLDENESIKVKFIKYAIVFALYNFLHRLA